MLYARLQYVRDKIAALSGYDGISGNAGGPGYGTDKIAVSDALMRAAFLSKLRKGGSSLEALTKQVVRMDASRYKAYKAALAARQAQMGTNLVGNTTYQKADRWVRSFYGKDRARPRDLLGDLYHVRFGPNKQGIAKMLDDFKGHEALPGLKQLQAGMERRAVVLNDDIIGKHLMKKYDPAGYKDLFQANKEYVQGFVPREFFPWK